LTGPGRHLNRREFVAGASAGAAFLTLPGCGGGEDKGPPEDLLKVGRVADLYADGWRPSRIRIGGAAVTVYLRLEREASEGEEPRVLAVSGRCTHQGCPTRYVEAARKFVCPCHGAVFGFDGAPEGGPAKRALDRADPVVRDGMVYLKRQR
jgi:Rieske Fe-S protein